MPHKWYKFDLGTGEIGKNSGKRMGDRKKLFLSQGSMAEIVIILSMVLSNTQYKM